MKARRKIKKVKPVKAWVIQLEDAVHCWIVPTTIRITRQACVADWRAENIPKAWDNGRNVTTKCVRVQVTVSK